MFTSSPLSQSGEVRVGLRGSFPDLRRELCPLRIIAQVEPRAYSPLVPILEVPFLPFALARTEAMETREYQTVTHSSDGHQTH